MKVVHPSRSAVKRPLLILLVLALLASTVIPALADSGKVYRLAGDFNGDGVTTPGWFTDGMFVLYGATAGGDTVRFRYGRSGDVPVVGDWKGDGRDTVGVVRNGRRWLLRDSNTSGDADRTFIYGGWLGRDRPVVGDWTGKGFDAPGVVRGSTWHLRTTLSSGNADITFTYGRVDRGDIPVAGDWTNKGRDTAGVVRSGVWHLRDSNRGGSADWIVKYGRKGDVPVVGNWDGRGGDTPGVVRGTTWMLKNTLSGGAADVTVDLADATVTDALTEPEIVAMKKPTTKIKPVAPAKPVSQPEPEEASTEPPPSTESETVVVEEAAPEPTQEPVSEPTEQPASGGAVDGGSGAGAAFAALLSVDELAIQRDRAANGPFRTAGDFSANSPGHWNEMAATMRLNFSSARWSGPAVLGSNGRVLKFNDGLSSGLENDPPANVRQMAHDMMSAAHAAAITGNHTVAAAITKEIEYQATRPRLDYSNRTLWPFNYYNDVNPLFMHTVWVKDYVLAYDITKAMGHSSSIVERWFQDLAELSEQSVHESLSRVFPDRKNDSYSSRASFVNTTLFASTRSADGRLIQYPRITLFYNNRRSNLAGFYGLVGVVLDNPRYKEEFKRYGREWLMFGHRVTSSDGLHGDVNRGNNSFPQLGLSYGLHALESLIPAMDGLARQGDTSLYEFSSRDGAATPSGGTNHYKTMEGVLDTYIRWIKGSYPAQYTGSGDPPSTSIAGNAYYRIQSRNSANGREIVNDASLLLPANYYNRADWRDVIMRKGTPSGFSAQPQGVGSIGGWRADWRHRFLRSLDTDPYPSRG
jgi:hypothetical protein